jgi:hypothetical protein
LATRYCVGIYRYSCQVSCTPSPKNSQKE